MFRDETRARLLGIMEGLKEKDHIQGLVLGGTELPLILPNATYGGIPFLDTTKIHTDRVVAEAMS